MSSTSESHARSFQSISAGRAVELVSELLEATNTEAIDRLLELIAGITDEAGDHRRHAAAVAAMRYAHALRDEGWLVRVECLQSLGQAQGCLGESGAAL